ncbi:hypothetical protein HMPREF0556_10917 [Listeria grayi DSM 20601]|uniref:Uncharacterized protein n=1 Tax=Listeria grayi DSM 20601 TaxID=525367 RepID=D7UXF6_LISGR|nr:hypothetical protein HMPREF0556_10917 [Listeria grayi DSM 20601]
MLQIETRLSLLYVDYFTLLLYIFKNRLASKGRFLFFLRKPVKIFIEKHCIDGKSNDRKE